MVVMMVVLVLLVLFVVVVMAALVLLPILMVVMVVVLLLIILPGVGQVGGLGLGQQLGHQVPLAVHDRHNLCAGQLAPVGGHNGGGGVLGLQQRHGGGHLLLVGGAGAAQQNAGGMADLVVIELAKVLHIHFNLVHVGDGHKAVEGDGQRLGHALHGAGHVAELAHAGRLNEDAVGMVGVHHLFQRLPEIAHQRAADAARIQLVDLDAGLPHESAVNADLAKFVLDQDDLLPGEGFLDELFDERGLAGAQETRKNINFGAFFCHNTVPSIHKNQN